MNPTRIFTQRVGRHEVCFTRHAVMAFNTRCAPTLHYKAARTLLKVCLREGAVVVAPDPPDWLKSSRWARARAQEFVVVRDLRACGVDDELCLPLNQSVGGAWWCPTIMSRATSTHHPKKV